MWGAGAYLLYYPMGRLHVGLGGRVSFNLNAEGLSYESIRKVWIRPVQLRERLSHGRTSARQDKGDMDASAGCMVGYTFDHGISLEAGYHFGLGDLMVTKQTTIVGLTPPTGCNQSILNWAMLSVRWANSILSSLLSAFLLLLFPQQPQEAITSSSATDTSAMMAGTMMATWGE